MLDKLSHSMAFIARLTRTAFVLLVVLSFALQGASARPRSTHIGLDGVPDLNNYLSIQRLVYPGAAVCAGFYDWRTVSQYRSTAGLHLGYDVAMPAGTAAVAGWPGQVTRVARWYDTEYGITVLSPSGYETTYGHLSPRVKVGDVLNAGDTVGLVVNDHVDIKMRGPDGTYFDFGHSTPPAVGFFPGAGPYRPTPSNALQTYVSTYYGMKLDEEELKLARLNQQQAALELADLKTRLHTSHDEVPRMRQFFKDGLVARVDLEKAESEARNGATRLRELQGRVNFAQRDLAMRQARLEVMRGQLAMCRRVLGGMGISQAELEKKLRSPTSSQSVEQARELSEIRARNRQRLASRHGSLDARAAAKTEMLRMQQLYEQGVVSRLERDRARAFRSAALSQRSSALGLRSLESRGWLQTKPMLRSSPTDGYRKTFNGREVEPPFNRKEVPHVACAAPPWEWSSR